MNNQWKRLIVSYRSAPIEFDALKVVTLAQWALESGRGTSWLAQHANNFAGLKYRGDIADFVGSVDYDEGRGEEDKQYCKFDSVVNFIRGYWAFIERAPYDGWREAAAQGAREYLSYIVSAGYYDASPEAQEDYLSHVHDILPEAAALLSEDSIIEVPETDDPELSAPPFDAGLCEGRGVLLEVGHGPQADGRHDPGAVGPGGVEEHALNRRCARICRDMLRRRGVPCDVTDAAGSLPALGRMGEGHDVFCSVHFNAYNGIAQGSEVFVHQTDADSNDERLAALCSDAVSSALNIRDRGVKNHRNLGVLRGAESASVRAAILAEIAFLDAIPEGEHFDWAERGGAALATGIFNWLSETNRPDRGRIGLA